MSEYKVSNFSIFNDAVNHIRGLNDNLKNIQKDINNYKGTLNDENIFLGPVADNTLNAYVDVNNKIDSNVSNYNKIDNYLEEVANSYVNNDSKASDKAASDIDISNSGNVSVLYLNEGGTITTTNTSVSPGNTQAREFYALGDKAYNAYQSNDPSIQEWIEKVGKIVQNTNTYGMKKSLIIAQIINESGWMSSHASSLSNYNNVLGVNTDMGRITPDMQTSTWSKKKTSGYNNVTQWSSDGSHIVGTNESMRHYDSVEECIEDYANILSLYHPECVGSNNLEDYRSFLESYTPNPNGSTTNKYANIINKYNLSRFDT